MMLPNISLKPNPSPLLKWVGGKRELIPEISKYYNELDFNNYFELFFGGGAVFFDIIKKFGLDKVPNSFLNDTNQDLINLLKDVKDNSLILIDQLHKLKEEYETYGYYHIRDRYNGIDKEKTSLTKYSGIERSAALILLNKTCFNGLYRVNGKGLFNVPTGRYVNPKIIDIHNINEVSSILPPIANITCLDFSSIRNIKKSDFVYLDPPYHPLNKSSFTEYSNQFGEKQQIKLFKYFKELDDLGAYVLLSNSSAPFIKELYKIYSPISVLCGRNINSKGDGRGKIEEVLVIGNSLKNKLGI